MYLGIIAFMCFCLAQLPLLVECSELFYATSTLNHGLHEVLLQTGKIKAKQLAAGPKEGTDSGIVTRQITNGRILITLIYNGIPPSIEAEEGSKTPSDETPSLITPDEDNLLLRECKVDKQTEIVDEFIQEFDAAVVASRFVAEGKDSEFIKESQYIIQNGSQNLTVDISFLTNFKHLKHQCFRLRRSMRKLGEESRRGRKTRNSETELHKRSKRSATDLLLMPNTNWCGAGHRARTYRDLGGLHGADMCCRQHDMHCPFFIKSFKSRYGYFNFGLTTLSHCACDRRFKACLKHTGTGASDVVGKVFFNLVKSKCFVFERRRVCRKGGYWRCYKYGYEKQAVVKESIPWV